MECCHLTRKQTIIFLVTTKVETYSVLLELKAKLPYGFMTRYILFGNVTEVHSLDDSCLSVVGELRAVKWLKRNT